MLKVDQQWLDQAETNYPGILKTIYYYENKDLPTCPLCGSPDTAMVSTGIIGRTTHIAAATTKMRLLINGHPADYCCNQCEHYFDSPNGATIVTLVPKHKK